jgi:hypothetical protein
MKTLKDKQIYIDRGIIIDSYIFQPEDVKEAVLELINRRKTAIKTLNMNYRYDKELSAYLTSNQQFLIDIEEIFGDFEK